MVVTTGTVRCCDVHAASKFNRCQSGRLAAKLPIRRMGRAKVLGGVVAHRLNASQVEPLPGQPEITILLHREPALGGPG